MWDKRLALLRMYRARKNEANEFSDVLVSRDATARHARGRFRLPKRRFPRGAGFSALFPLFSIGDFDRSEYFRRNCGLRHGVTVYEANFLCFTIGFDVAVWRMRGNVFLWVYWIRHGRFMERICYLFSNTLF